MDTEEETKEDLVEPTTPVPVAPKLSNGPTPSVVENAMSAANEFIIAPGAMAFSIIVCCNDYSKHRRYDSMNAVIDDVLTVRRTLPELNIPFTEEFLMVNPTLNELQVVFKDI
mgnify:CR=1 FL=1